MDAESRETPTFARLDDLERDATAAYLSGNEAESEALWERAHAESLRAGDPQRAGRAAFWLILDLFTRGERARGSGWLARALRSLESLQESAAFGLLSVLASRQHLLQGEIDAAELAAHRAAELARRFGDADLMIFSGLALAQLQARRGRFADAAALFDEIMVAVTVDDVSPIAVGVVCCAVIDGCYLLFDFDRARAWTSALLRWAATQPNATMFRGKCLVHHVETLRLSGEWPDALVEAERACEYSVAYRNPFKYPAGAAFYELGELYRLRGNLPQAEAAYRRANEYGQLPEPGLVLLQLAQGHPEAAANAVHRLMSERQSNASRATILRAAVEILIAAGDVATARVAADELERLAEPYYAPASRALAAEASGAVCLAEGNVPTALAHLRESWTLWQELGAPYEAARVRVLLAQACRQAGDAAAAELELETARSVFDRLGAGPDVKRVDALRQPRRDSADQVLTPRELQVIDLVAKGKTNRAIAEELSISERTVDRHVSNILLKLELPSRSAATAYAYRHHLL